VIASSSQNVSATGFDGTYYIDGTTPNGLSTGSLYCSVINELSNNRSIWGFVYEQFYIRIGITCDNETDQYGVYSVIVDTTRFDIGCSDGVLFSWGTNSPTPIRDGLFLTPDDNRVTYMGNVTVGTIQIEAIENCVEQPTTYYATMCGDASQRITVDLASPVRPRLHHWCLYEGDQYSLTGEQSSDPPVQVEWVNQPCPIEWPRAQSCDGQSVITYDPSLRPADGVTLVVGSVRYVPISGVATTPPSDGVWSPDPCPDGTEIYQIRFCRSSQVANQTFSFDPDTNGLQSQTVGYRPGNGLQPGEGHVLIRLPGAAGCLTQVAATPTDIPLSTEPEVVLTSRPGTCRGLPSVVVDPRSQCQQTDGGGGGTIPDSPNLTALSDSTDTGSMGLGDAVERAIKTITLNQLATCPACQRRKEVLNQFGLTVGRAVLRRLGW